MSAWSSVYRNALFPLWESGIRRRPTLDRLAELRRTEWTSPDELAERQSQDLSRLVRHAHDHVPFWRHWLDQAGVGREGIRHVDDLSKIPITTRSDLVDTVRLRSTTTAPFPTISKSTSGSSGTPITFAYDTDSEHWRQAVRLRGYGWAGYHPGDKAIHYWGGAATKPSRFTALKISLDRRLRGDIYVDSGRRDPASLDGVVETIRRERPAALVCFAQSVADLARHVNRHGLRTWHDLRVLTGAERLFPHDREAIVTAFGPHVFETYGSREVMLMAAECEAHDGLHVSMENLIVEIVVHENGRTRAAAPGETGEVIVTDLHNTAMPFIRYRNGDLATAKPRGRCACGRGLDRLARVDGRVTETLRDGKGGSVGGLIFSVVMVRIANAVLQWQCVQRADDSVLVRIVPSPEFGDDAREALFAMAKTYLPGLPFEIELTQTIAAAKSGKRQLVVVEPRALSPARQPIEDAYRQAFADGDEGARAPEHDRRSIAGVAIEAHHERRSELGRVLSDSFHGDCRAHRPRQRSAIGVERRRWVRRSPGVRHHQPQQLARRPGECDDDAIRCVASRRKEDDRHDVFAVAEGQRAFEQRFVLGRADQHVSDRDR